MDTYYTPDALAEALVGLLPLEPWRGYLEPHVGGGAFARALRRRMPEAFVYGIDIDPAAAGLRDCSKAMGGLDFLAADWRHGHPDWIIGNPPYRDAEAHVRAALGAARVGVAFLLRLAMLETHERAPLWRDYPPRKVWVLQERPSFTGSGTDSCAYGWFWWDREHRGPTEMGWVSWRAPRTRRPVGTTAPRGDVGTEPSAPVGSVGTDLTVPSAAPGSMG